MITIAQERYVNRAMVWTFVLALNLILPLLFGFSIAGKSGLFGMSIGIALVWLTGVWACRWPKLMEVMSRGGIVVAGFQGFPFFHIAIGMFALWLVALVPGQNHIKLLDDDFNGEIGNRSTLLATMVTAILLILPAFFLGGGHRLLLAPPLGPETPDYEDTDDRIAEAVSSNDEEPDGRLEEPAAQ